MGTEQRVLTRGGRLVEHHRDKISAIWIFLGSRVAGADGEVPHLAIADDVASGRRERLRLGVGVAEDVAGVGECHAVLFRFS